MESCLIIAGEKSGEEHALSFYTDLKKLNPNVNFFGVGGHDLQKEGLELIYHLNDFSSWGYSEVIAKIPFYKKAMEVLIEECIKRNTKVAILVDFQSFNMKLGEKLAELGIKVEYYVAPQAWAWKEYRVKKLKKFVDTLYTIIPFEKKWFNDRGIDKVISIEHPQLTTHKVEIENFKRKDFNKEKLKILLLPGSRNFEVASLLDVFIESITYIRKSFNVEVSIVKSSSVNSKLYESYEGFFDKVYFNDNLVTAIKDADFALAASGTVTLTCALFELPTIVAYKSSLINYFIYEYFVPYKGPISLANIVHNRSVFPELIQDQVSAFNITAILKKWYNSSEEYLNLRKELANTKILVQGEKIIIPQYLSDIIRKAYGRV